MFIEYNPNPVGRTVRDCAIRAVTKALDISWEDAFALIAANAFAMGDMMDADSVWGAVLRQHGFYKELITPCRIDDDYNLDCYTAEEFAMDNPEGVFVLGFGGHVATVVDGDLYDSWDSSKEIPIYVWRL